ncbi:MAG: KH domain-containing protein [Candidatus Nanoarchaeia archaeon]|nr:KH domain-containing protein [Candidatus Nanoarchaeia archaeon]
MKKLICERAGEIIKNKGTLEKALDIKITSRGKEIFIDGLPLEEYEAEKVIDAINFGFKADIALQIKERELAFEIMHIKKFTTRTNLESVRARVIGTKGKTLKTFMELTNCFIEVRNNDIGIIGNPESMKATQVAIISLIKGSKQASVYKYLEKHHVQPVFDLGLKEVRKKKE